MFAASLWPDATTTVEAMRLCNVTQSREVTNGRFELALDACVAAVRTSRDPWLQVTVGGVDLPRTKLGAVPYAIEASYASNPVGPLLARIAALETRVSDDCPPGYTRNLTETGFRDIDEELSAALAPAWSPARGGFDTRCAGVSGRATARPQPARSCRCAASTP